MRVYCPNCGSENEGAHGERITCARCATAFDVPQDRAPLAPLPAGPVTPSPLGSFKGPGQEVSRAPGARVGGGGGASGKYNTLAIASATMGLVCCVPLGPFVAIGTGIAALKQIEVSQGRERGKGLAVAGIALGALSAALQVWALVELGVH